MGVLGDIGGQNGQCFGAPKGAYKYNDLYIKPLRITRHISRI